VKDDDMNVHAHAGTATYPANTSGATYHPSTHTAHSQKAAPYLISCVVYRVSGLAKDSHLAGFCASLGGWRHKASQEAGREWISGALAASCWCRSVQTLAVFCVSARDDIVRMAICLLDGMSSICSAAISPRRQNATDTAHAALLEPS
jgi:hypothetical protein